MDDWGLKTLRIKATGWKEHTQASLAAKHATKTIPIVFAAVSDPLGTGLVVSLARPGANVTGTAGMRADLVGKSLDHGSTSPRFASTQRNHASRHASTDFCNNTLAMRTIPDRVRNHGHGLDGGVQAQIVTIFAKTIHARVVPMTYFVGLDGGLEETNVCVIDSEGNHGSRGQGQH